MNTRINFSKWGRLTTLRIWEVAAMMEGYDPDELAVGAIVINDHGDPPDLAHEERLLVSAVLTSDVRGVGEGLNNPDRHTLISLSSLCPWLERLGYGELVFRLKAGAEPDAPLHLIESEPERRLRRLRAMGGSAEWSARKSDWALKGIGELVAAEASEGRGRVSDKTVRADLVSALEAERAKQREGGDAASFLR